MRENRSAPSRNVTDRTEPTCFPLHHSAVTAGAELTEDSAATKMTNTRSLLILFLLAVALPGWSQSGAPNTQSVKDFGAVGNGVVDDTAAIQKAFNATAGRRLFVPAGRYLINSAVTLPGNIVIEGEGEKSAFVCNSAAGQFTATNQNNITFRNLQFTTAGINTFVPTFTLSDRITFDKVVFRAKLASGNLGSTTLRTYGSTRLTVQASRFYDADSFIYLDKSGTTNSDEITVKNSHFEHTVVGHTNNPTGIYQYNANRLLVEGNVFKNIVAGGSAPIAGYGVYAGDGSSTSTQVVNNTAVSTIPGKVFIFIQDAQSSDSLAVDNKFEAPAGSGSALYQGGAGTGTVRVERNRARQGGIFILGGRTAATALKEALILGNEILKMEHPTVGIRIGVGGAYYVGHAIVRDNLVVETYAASLYVAECADAEVVGNRFFNANTANGYQGHKESVYLDAVAWDGLRGRFTGNIVANDSTHGSKGYARYGLAVANAANTVSESNNVFTGMVTARTFQVKQSR